MINCSVFASKLTKNNSIADELLTEKKPSNHSLALSLINVVIYNTANEIIKLLLVIAVKILWNFLSHYYQI